ncbi:hypothetical protein F3J20_24985 [Paraburkholderia sp. Cy-641]|uniref:hypothetical protein n=1 Tax=Paraburkholderia sp. Cy-641 TaxID=2608337 RepID=UPI00141F0F1A|nr:hypothetical protein [Paraburkholderia sp. Cy-641]NIF80602.1 hypothetical protein [Paraburkholderia sp. Cy-641]
MSFSPAGAGRQYAMPRAWLHRESQVGTPRVFPYADLIGFITLATGRFRSFDLTPRGARRLPPSSRKFFSRVFPLIHKGLCAFRRAPGGFQARVGMAIA